jgi:hypothetical protein
VGDVKRWPKSSGRMTPRAPHRIDKAADYELLLAVGNMEKQWGTIETYNRLVEHCDRLRAKIARGLGVPPSLDPDNSCMRPPIPASMKK